MARNVFESVLRHGKPTSERSRSQAVFYNFFLHVHPVRIHKDTLKWSTTLGFGVIAAALFGLLTVTGILLMYYYRPDVNQAYNSIKDIHYIIPTGRMIRNIHRWAAHGMVLIVILHMCRVFYTGAYKKPREMNWLVGLGLLVLTLALSFTGYLLPWDQLGFWAATIGANIAQSPREITDALGMTGFFDVGGIQKELMLGGHEVGQEALIRFYVLHVVIIPLALTVLMGLHFWRIRKDGGLARPEKRKDKSGALEERNALLESSNKTYGLMALVKGKSAHTDRETEDTVSTWPNTFYAELALIMFTIMVLSVWGYYMDAPLMEPANPTVPENPAKAPWYFLGLQELVSYSAFTGGVGLPGLIVVLLALIPYLDRERNDVGLWFGGKRGKAIVSQSLIFSTVVVLAMLTFNVRFGWLRDWFQDIPQIVITLVNPGTVFLLLFTIWSAYILRRENSTRLAAIAFFTCFIISFFILTYFATVHRGPNWDFYWARSHWPLH